LGPSRRRSQKNNRRRIKELRAVMFPYPEDIKSNPIGRLHFLEQISESNDRIDHRSRHGIG